MKTLRRTLEREICKYNDMKARCNQTAAEYYVDHYFTYLKIWGGNTCGMLLSNFVVYTT